MKRFARHAITLLLATAGGSTSPAFAIQYSISAYNFTLGGDEMYAAGINSHGALVGWSTTGHETWPDGGSGTPDEPGQEPPVPVLDEHAFVYENGVLTDLGTLGGINSQGSQLNDQGVAVGTSDNVNGHQRAFRYENGVMWDLGTLGGNRSNATAVNNNNQIVGSSTTTANVSHAFLYENGVMTDLGTLGGTVSVANDINIHGHVVGQSWIAGGTIEHAFVFQNGIMQDLGVLPGTQVSRALAINDAGQIVGHSGQRAFLYNDGVMTELFGLSSGPAAVWVGDINNDGTIVGSSRPEGENDYNAVMWKDGALVNLNSLVSPDWSLHHAWAINDAGQILGRGTYQGVSAFYVLTPVPLPASAWLFGSGVAALIGMARTRVRGPQPLQ